MWNDFIGDDDDDMDFDEFGYVFDVYALRSKRFRTSNVSPQIGGQTNERSENPAS